MSRKKFSFIISAFATVLLSLNAAAAGRSAFSSYEIYLRDAVASAGLPEKVAYMPLVLTGGDPSYREGSAAGLWSVTAPIARHYGIAVSDGFDGRYDVEYCTSAALSYFSDIYRRNGGDLAAAMSQYAIAAGQSSKADNFMTLLTEACQRYEDLRNDKSDKMVSVTLEQAVRLTDLCKALNLRSSQLQADNPAIISGNGSLPANARLRLAEDKAGLFAQVSAKLYDAAKSAEEKYDTHLAAQPEPVKENVEPEADRTGSVSAAAPVKPKPQQSAKPKQSTKPAVTYYKVKNGDTLSGIASKFHVSVSQLKKWNNLKSDSIRAGIALKINK